MLLVKDQMLHVSLLLVFVSSESEVSAERYRGFRTRARMHHKVVGNFGSEADVRSLYYQRFRFNEASDVGACTHDRLTK